MAVLVAALESWLASGMAEKAGNLTESWKAGKDSILDELCRAGGKKYFNEGVEVECRLNAMSG